MFIYTLKFDRKKALFWTVMAALVLIGIVLLVGAAQKASAAPAAAEKAPSLAVKNEKARVAWLNRNGWQVESPAESEGKVLIPRSFSAVFEDYNELQKKQGFDLSRFCGQEVTMFTYRVTNPEFSGDEVLAVLYVLDSTIVGGDVHSTALDGFMMGVKQD
ncbi:MAG: DUF4830 domain-containing protein [Oscillospiraceae bacterium]|nr:DUF4830 domain-containing protein [Oscillospiraceae bacterium]